MKSLLIILVSVFWGISQIFAQITSPIVHDPLNAVSLGEIIVKSEQQISNLNQQLSLAKKLQEKVEKVNNTVKTLRMAEDMVTKSAKTITRINKLLDALKKTDGLSPSYLRVCSGRCNDAIGSIIDSMNFLDKVLGTGFNMSDRERIESMRETMQEVERASIAVDRVYSQAESLAKARKLLLNK